MYSVLFVLVSIFCYSTLIQSMEKKTHNLTALAKEALSDSDKLLRFDQLCSNGAYDENALHYLIEEQRKLEVEHSQKPLLAGDEIYMPHPQNPQEILTRFSRSIHIEQMIDSLIRSKTKQQ